MVNLFATLDSVTGALRSFQEGIAISQNNVNNAATPGYAKQRVSLHALPFQPQAGLVGGVRTGPVENSRSEFAEQSVRGYLSSFGNFAQQTSSLSQIEAALDVSGESGIPAALNRLSNSFAAFSASPNSATARQAVIDAAGQVTRSFNRAAQELSRIGNQLDAELSQTIANINQIAARIQGYNERILKSPSPDAGLEAAAFADVEELSELVELQVIVEANGTMTVLLGGQAPLVTGGERHEIGLEFFTPGGALNPGAQPSVRVVDASGRDITNVASEGRLGGLLYVRGQALPSLNGDATQDGSLNVLAKHVADRVNGILTNGLVSAGPPPVAGSPLFAYDPTNNASVAATLALDPLASPDLLAAISPGPPFVSNGAALELADLLASRDPADTISGVPILEFYGSMARTVGNSLKTARQEEAGATFQVTQARDLRSQLSGVSLNEEAVQLMQFQRAYQASAEVVQVVDELLQTVLSLRR